MIEDVWKEESSLTRSLFADTNKSIDELRLFPFPSLSSIAAASVC
jgi:hypothetical protein